MKKEYDEYDDDNADFYKNLMRNNIQGKTTILPEIHENRLE